MYIGAILCFTGTYLDNTTKVDNLHNIGFAAFRYYTNAIKH
jgi:hypothetical protein